MTVGSRIRSRRKQLKLSVDELGRKIGKNRATIYRYESDEIENMPYDVVPSLAEALRVSPGYLMGWEETKVEQLATVYNYIPVPVSAGMLSTIEGITDDEVESITLPDSLMGKHAGSKDIYLTKVNGDSMNNLFPNGSLIAVKQVDIHDLKDDDIVVFSNGNEFSVKRYFNDIDNERIIFSPESTDRRFLDYSVSYSESTDLKIHGKVVLYIVEAD